MTRKPFACMLAMLFCVATASGFAACGNRGEDSSGSGSANNFEEGVYTNAVEAKTVKQNPADSREDAYEAFSTDGESLGTYKTIAAAINEAVANDAAEEKYGGYVEKLGGGGINFSLIEKDMPKETTMCSGIMTRGQNLRRWIVSIRRGLSPCSIIRI